MAPMNIPTGARPSLFSWVKASRMNGTRANIRFIKTLGAPKQGKGNKVSTDTQNNGRRASDPVCIVTEISVGSLAVMPMNMLHGLKRVLGKQVANSCRELRPSKPRRRNGRLPALRLAGFCCQFGQLNGATVRISPPQQPR